MSYATPYATPFAMHLLFKFLSECIMKLSLDRSVCQPKATVNVCDHVCIASDARTSTTPSMLSPIAGRSSLFKVVCVVFGPHIAF